MVQFLFWEWEVCRLKIAAQRVKRKTIYEILHLIYEVTHRIYDQYNTQVAVRPAPSHPAPGGMSPTALFMKNSDSN